MLIEWISYKLTGVFRKVYASPTLYLYMQLPCNRTEYTFNGKESENIRNGVYIAVIYTNIGASPDCKITYLIIYFYKPAE